MPTESPRRSWLYRLTIPWIWLITAFISWRNPGDEYGLFAVGNGLPMLMAAFLLEHFLPAQYLLITIIACSGLSMFLLSWLLDRLHVPLPFFVTAYVVFAIGFLALVLRQFESYERAISKNGSAWAYISSASNIAVSLSAGLAIIVFAIWRLVQAWRRPPVAS